MWISKQRLRHFERASREVIADPKVYVQAGVAMFWVHRDSVTLKACFHACAPQLFSPSYRLSKERPLSSHPNLRRLLLGVASHPTPLATAFRRELPTRGFGPHHDIT